VVPQLQPPAHPVFSIERALESVEGDPMLLKHMVELFMRQTPKVVAGMREALERADAPALEHAAHRLKGSMSLFGAEAACELAAQLEDMAHAGNLTPACDAQARLDREVGRLIAALAKATDAAAR
jgi:two-component system, sensor histidine kinase and response regulator